MRIRGTRTLACSADTPVGVPGLAGAHAVRSDRAARTSAQCHLVSGLILQPEHSM